MPDFCFILSCHDKVEELLCHLEILSFCPIPYDVIVVHSGKDPLPNLGVLVVKSPETATPPLGAALAFLKGIMTAKRPPLPYVQQSFRYACYRNCDDWLFNYDHVIGTLNAMRAGQKRLAGYNWFDAGLYDDLALNELFIDMSVLEGVSLREWEGYFRANVRNRCEYAIAAKLFSLIRRHEFLRLAERETLRGIGINTDDKDNNRYFNREWQLLGHHNKEHKLRAYRAIRDKVPYANKLEVMPCFEKWDK